MSDQPQKSVSIRQFPGLVTQADPHDTNPGAASVQINIRSDRPGELNVRRGMRLVEFDEN